IARGSVNETKHWLRRAYKRNLLSDTQVDSLKPLLAELAPKLNAYANALSRRQAATKPSTINDQPSNI
ncbi:MAG: four helix bundle protein, partial [Acidobacteria bacterium]|nr:four helix bundle protein [Acidobacteriota bacterium]